MACTGVEVTKDKQFTVQVIHAQEKYAVDLDTANGRTPTVEEFAAKVASLTNIPISKQRLIFKGRSLTNMTAPLASYGLKSGCKVMVLGSKVCAEDDANGLAMNAINVDVTKNSDKLDDVIQQFADIQRGFLAAALQEEALLQLDRKLRVCIELFMRQLEQLDGLSLASSSEDMKDKRRSIVRRIQMLLERADSLHNNIVEVTAQLSVTKVHGTRSSPTTN
jgi:hypothetical protein